MGKAKYYLIETFDPEHAYIVTANKTVAKNIIKEYKSQPFDVEEPILTKINKDSVYIEAD